MSNIFHGKCPKGHNKLKPHGMYAWERPDGTIGYQCGVCKRALSIRTRHRKK